MKIKHKVLSGVVVSTALVLPMGLHALQYTEDRQPCADRSPLRNPYFGDLHVHTSRSFDAVSAGTRATPRDAYDFARGREIGIPPFDADGKPFKSVRIDRPLDFMAVTDHAEFLGETGICTTKGSTGYNAQACENVRPGGHADARGFPAAITHQTPARSVELCGEEGNGCAAMAGVVWQETQAEAENAYDRSARCSFTAFIGYEYSATPGGSNLHRNVIFRNDKVPPRPISYLDEPDPVAMLRALNQACGKDVAGCQFVSIPHNSNLSNGKMFPPIAGNGEEAKSSARLRANGEPIMEIIQHKGSSECANGLSATVGGPDELCDMEQVRQMGGGNELDMARLKEIFGVEFPPVTDCEDPHTRNIQGFGTANKGCISSYDFARGALLLGLSEEKRLGVNPYHFGFIGSTDTHLGTGGNVRESNWTGHLGYETKLEQRLSLGFMPSNRLGNPGGLAGVWAEENSRDAIFDSFKRKEVFATSGPRIRPRFFASSRFDSSLCADPDRIKKAYQLGVPMGGDLGRDSLQGRPRFLALASRDNADWSVPLQKIQVVKGWLTGEGEKRFKVFDVVQADRTEGATELCTVFEDPEFAPDQSAYYYMRVVEMPSKRWDAQQCQNAGTDTPEACKDVGKNLIQEMAWTSPIWYRP